MKKFYILLIAMFLTAGAAYAQSNDSIERAKQQEALLKQQQKEQQELLKQQQKEQEALQKEQQKAAQKAQEERMKEQQKLQNRAPDIIAQRHANHEDRDRERIDQRGAERGKKRVDQLGGAGIAPDASVKPEECEYHHAAERINRDRAAVGLKVLPGNLGKHEVKPAPEGGKIGGMDRGDVINDQQRRKDPPAPGAGRAAARHPLRIG